MECSEFLHDVGYHHRFSGKNPVVVFLGQKCSRWTQHEVFQVLQKIHTCNFSDFLHEVAATKSLKIDLHDCFGKNLVLSFWAKTAQIGVFPVYGK